MSQTVVLNVKMSCQGCAGAVQRVLGKMEGVESFDIDMKEQKVTVKGNVQSQAVFEAVSKTGKKTAFWEAQAPPTEPQVKPTEEAPAQPEQKPAEAAPAKSEEKPTDSAPASSKDMPAEAAAPAGSEDKPAEAAAPANSEVKPAEAVAAA